MIHDVIQLFPQGIPQDLALQIRVLHHLSKLLGGQTFKKRKALGGNRLKPLTQNGDGGKIVWRKDHRRRNAVQRWSQIHSAQTISVRVSIDTIEQWYYEEFLTKLAAEQLDAVAAIEQAFAKRKAFRRAARPRRFHQVCELMAIAIGLFTATECTNCVRPAGTASPQRYANAKIHVIL